MKPGGALFVLACTAAALWAGPPEIARPYLPADIWRDARDAAFHERWFGGQLRAMREPTLSRPSDSAGFRRRFRMLVLPSFHPAYAVRVDEEDSGRASVHIVRLNGAGGMAPGSIKEAESFILPAGETRSLFRAIDSSAMASLPSVGPPPTCLDGVSFSFELVDARRAHFVTRHQCGLDPPLETLIGRIDALRRTVGSDLGAYRNNGSLR